MNATTANFIQISRNGKASYQAVLQGQAETIKTRSVREIGRKLANLLAGVTVSYSAVATLDATPATRSMMLATLQDCGVWLVPDAEVEPEVRSEFITEENVVEVLAETSDEDGCDRTYCDECGTETLAGASLCVRCERATRDAELEDRDDEELPSDCVDAPAEDVEEEPADAPESDADRAAREEYELQLQSGVETAKAAKAAKAAPKAETEEQAALRMAVAVAKAEGEEKLAAAKAAIESAKLNLRTVEESVRQAIAEAVAAAKAAGARVAKTTSTPVVRSTKSPAVQKMADFLTAVLEERTPVNGVIVIPMADFQADSRPTDSSKKWANDWNGVQFAPGKAVALNEKLAKASLRKDGLHLFLQQ